MGEKVERRGRGHVQRPTGFANDYAKAEAATSLAQTPLEAELVRGDPDKGKRFRKAGGAGHVIRKPHLDQILRDGYAVSALELQRLSKKALTDDGLTADELKRYSILVDAISKLGRTEKEHFPDDDDAALTPEEQIAQAKAALKFLQDQQKDK